VEDTSQIDDDCHYHNVLSSHNLVYGIGSSYSGAERIMLNNFRLFLSLFCGVVRTRKEMIFSAEMFWWEFWLVVMITANTTINFIRLRIERRKGVKGSD